MEEKRIFKGIWIPKEVWLDERLDTFDKVIFCEIDSFSSENNVCYASNEYFAEFCHCSERKVSQSIQKLIELKYIELVSFNGRIRKLKSANIKNNIHNGNYDKSKKSKNGNENKNKKLNDIKEIINYLNEKALTHYRFSTKSTNNLINSRLNEGFTLDDFKLVIDKKCGEWINTDMEKYLRPETLFGTKFESYLNAPITKKSNNINSTWDFTDF